MRLPFQATYRLTVLIGIANVELPQWLKEVGLREVFSWVAIMELEFFPAG